ncbi:putative tRNA sulfurtransferase [Clostridia bacterium]|nr:putative tRNA sulfurtransferase [Clostridia bacterium]
MDEQAFLIKYSEIGLKGKNRYLFENALVAQIKKAVRPIGKFTVEKESGRIYVRALGEFIIDELILALQKVFGISGICPMLQIENQGEEQLKESIFSYLENRYSNIEHTFKVFTKRADKSYPKTSMQISADLGEAILKRFPQWKVDVHKPEISLTIEIRKKINIFSKEIAGPGGMPVGSSGKAMLLLSGGIDSPVAGYRIAKRGVVLEAVYFHSPPYTSERAKQKVIDLAKILSQYAGEVLLHVIPFTDIQLYIYEQCPHDELTILMRRYMMRIAQELAEESQAFGLITGESIGQVASQTMQSLIATNAVCTLPVYRPLIGMDKQEIIDLALKIGTYDTSILPYEDCCTIFVAKHPVTKPKLVAIEYSEQKLQEKIESLLQEAIEKREVLKISR